MLLWLLTSALLPTSLSYASQTQLAPLGGLGVCANMLSANILNGEPIHRSDFYALGMIVSGIMLAILGNPSLNQEYTAEEMENLIFAIPFALFFSIVLAGASFLVLGRKALTKRMMKAAEEGAAAERNTMLFSAASGALTGTLGGFSQSILKSIIEIVKATFSTQGLLAVVFKVCREVACRY